MKFQRQNYPANLYGTQEAPNNCPPGYGGYSVISDTEIGLYELGKTIQLYGSREAADDAGGAPSVYISENTSEVALVQQSVSSTSERLWIVTVNGIEFDLYSPPENPLPRLTKDQITTLSAKPPGSGRYSTLQAKISWMDGSASSHVKLIDIKGGTNFQVFGRNVQISILATPNVQIIENGDVVQTTNLLSGIVYNGLYSARIAPTLTGQTTLDIPQFTRWTQVPATATRFIEIPPGARRVRVFNSDLSGGATTELNFWLSNDPVRGYSVGILDFVHPNSTADFEIPCGATHISTDPSTAFDRYLSFVFIIDP